MALFEQFQDSLTHQLLFLCPCSGKSISVGGTGLQKLMKPDKWVNLQNRRGPVMLPSFNVLGGDLETCSTDPLTGWFRDGCCNTDRNDRGLHTVCCVLTEEFLEFARSRGNDLITPAPQHGFPGLEPGDRWCVCAQTWQDAADEGVACPVVLASTHEETLQIVALETLVQHSFENNQSSLTAPTS